MLKAIITVGISASGKSMKVKSTNYLIAYKLRGESAQPTRKHLLTALFDGDIDEIESYFPEWKGLIDVVKNDYNKFITSVKDVFSNTKHIDNQKDFALSVKHHEFSGWLFSARKKNTCPMEEFYALPTQSKLKLLGV